GSVALHPTNPEHRSEQLFRKPTLSALAREAGQNRVDLPATQRFLQRHEDVRRPKVAVILRDLVLEDQMIAKRVPGEIRHEAMILVEITPIVGQHEVRRHENLELLEGLL